ncbi:hypothetical protein BLA29_004504, partial [Euroglyphus maynei]
TEVPTTVNREDVYETVTITLPPPYDDSRDDGYFKRRPTTTTTTTSSTEMPSMTLQPMMETFEPHHHFQHDQDLMADQIPMFHPMISPPHHPQPTIITPFMPPPPIQSQHPTLMTAPLPRQCHFRIETICPTMAMVRRSQFQCFGDGIIHCDGRVSRMCRLFERQSYLRDQMQDDVHDISSSTSTTTDMPPPMIRYYRPDPRNYFYCNQPLMTDECVGVTECISDASFMTDMMDNPMATMNEEDEGPDIEYKKSSSSPHINHRPRPHSNFRPKQSEYEVNENDETIITAKPPPRYHSSPEEIMPEFDTTTVATSISTAIPTTTVSASKFDQDSMMMADDNGQSSSLRANQHDPPTTTRSHQPLSRVQVGLIGALIALGSLMFVMVAAVAYYSTEQNRKNENHT